jgi:hypothetical protein
LFMCNLGFFSKLRERIGARDLREREREKKKKKKKKKNLCSLFFCRQM